MQNRTLDGSAVRCELKANDSFLVNIGMNFEATHAKSPSNAATRIQTLRIHRPQRRHFSRYQLIPGQRLCPHHRAESIPALYTGL